LIPPLPCKIDAAPGGAQVDWKAAPPPVRRAAEQTPEPQTVLDLDAPPSTPTAPPWDATTEEEGGGYEPPEPWYYGFLEKYTLAGMWVGIVCITVPFLAFTVLLMVGGVAAAGVAGPAAAGVVGAGAFLWWLLSALAWASAVLALVFAAARILLAVDAARNLRALRYRSPGR
jgi:hypothetical protein